MRVRLPFAVVAAILLFLPLSAAGAELPPAPVTLQIESSVLGESREIWVALPRGYEDGDQRYPVLVLPDAGWHFEAAVAAVRFLAETSYIGVHRIPQLLVVGIVNHDRNEDHTPTKCVDQHHMRFPTSGGADDFLRFMNEELLPTIDERYRTQPHRILAGWSLGGLLTVHALLEHPDIFDGHLAISPSLWWEDRLLVTRAAELAASGARRDRDLVMSIGSLEEGGLCYEAVHDLVARWEETPLEGLRFEFLPLDGFDHNHGPYLAYYEGLKRLFANWFEPVEALEQGLEALQAHYAGLSERYGYPIPMPAHIYQTLIWQHMQADRVDEAVAVARIRFQEDPDSPMSWYHLAETYRQVGRTEQAREAYRSGMESELKTDEPDSVFVGYMSSWVERLSEDEG